MWTFYSTRQKFYLEKNLSSESSKIQKWPTLDSLEFLWLCFERVPSTRRVFWKENCNFYVSTENVLPYWLYDDTLNALLITNKFYKKEKLLQNKKDLLKQKLSSKPQSNPAKAAETAEAAVPKSLTQNQQIIPRSSRQNVPRSSTQNNKSKTAKVSSSIKSTLKDQSISLT